MVSHSKEIGRLRFGHFVIFGYLSWLLYRRTVSDTSWFRWMVRKMVLKSGDFDLTWCWCRENYVFWHVWYWDSVKGKSKWFLVRLSRVNLTNPIRHTFFRLFLNLLGSFSCGSISKPRVWNPLLGNWRILTRRCSVGRGWQVSLKNTGNVKVFERIWVARA